MGPWRLASGELVIDRPRSHLLPEVVPLLPEALAQVDAGGREFVEAEVDLGRVIGESICVATTDADRIVWVRRPGRAGPTRCVVGRAPEPCSTVTAILRRGDRGEEYVLITAYVGRIAGPEPWDRHATDASRAFWARHALIIEGERP